MKLENGIIYADSLAKNAGAAIIKNTGKAIAVITVIITVLLTFTDVAFSSFTSAEFTSKLTVMLIASYLMYFSLSDAGEKLCEDSAEYKSLIDEYAAVKSKIGGEDVDSLRDFLSEYSARELEARRKNMLVCTGHTRNEYERWQGGEKFARRTSRIFGRISRMKAVSLSPAVVLNARHSERHSELSDPKRFKLTKMLVKLLPTTVCMCVTFSVILTMKDGLTPEGIIESIIKLSTLPIVGFRGYCTGYGYIKNSELPWITTKKQILEAFIKERRTPVAA